MTDLAEAAQEFADLAVVLRQVGQDGLRRELYKAINDAAQPIEKGIRKGLRPHMPDRYADELNADLDLTIIKRTGTDPGITLTATASPRGGGSPSQRRSLTGRKLRRLESGLLTHPVFGNREVWKTQTGGMKPGFFTGPAEAAAPRVRREILAAMTEVTRKATRRF